MRKSVSGHSPVEDGSDIECTPSLPSAPPTRTATHPFFMKTSEKKRALQEEQRTLQEEQRERQQQAPTPNPTSASDNEEYLSKPSVPAPKPNGTRKKVTKTRKGKQTAALSRKRAQPSSSATMDLASVRTEIDLVTAAAAPLTPSSSVGGDVLSAGTGMETGVLEMDVDPQEKVVDPSLWRGTHKKQAPSPAPIVTTASPRRAALHRMVVDSGTEMVLNGGQASTPQKRGRLEVNRVENKLVIRASAEAASELLPKSTSAAATITSPTMPPPSSPPAQLPVGSPPARNAFELLGKKKVPEKPSPSGRKKGPPALGESLTAEPKPARNPGNSRNPRGRKIEDDQSPPKGRTTKPAVLAPEGMVVASNKATHPFFSAAGRNNMMQSAPPAAAKAATKTTDVTMLSPTQQRSLKIPGNRQEKKGGWLFSSFSDSTLSRAAKNSGLLDAPWPSRETVHVRGFDVSNHVTVATYPLPIRAAHKHKDPSSIPPEENILIKLASSLNVRKLQEEVSSENYPTFKYFDVSPDLKVPDRIVTTGSLLQETIRSRISARLAHPKALSQAEEESDSGEGFTVGGKSVHPAILKLYKRLGTTLTAFDVLECEPSPWEVKYAPETASELLQLGREKDILRQWLIGLRTDSVHVRKADDGKGKGKRKGRPKAAAAKKRKKKNSDLNGFMLDSEEEGNIMDELTDPEEDDWLNTTAKSKKSTVRSGDKMNEFMGRNNKANKTANAIVISGPTGSGKTAAVYAAAKELGYAVFEVNAGARRTGKDVSAQVGDMSRNHLVHRAKSASKTDNPFTKAAAAAPKDVAELEDGMQMRQKQSLILFEEVDILYDEDKGFWSTVIALTAQSKRPVVLTCTDESRIPWKDLCLHAVLRFSTPPRALLVDYLMLMAANEGHLLERSAVEGLARGNRDDLRSSIMDLQFYCRMTVGDRKGGLDWMIGRYPKGSDIADNGEQLRVVSEGTYHAGMGMVRNVPGFKEADKWLDVWEAYGLDVGASNEGIHGCFNDMPMDQPEDRLAALKLSESFFDARSDADAFASLSGLHMDDDLQLDSSFPKRSEKTRLDDLCGYRVLQTEPHFVPGSVGTEMAVYTRSLARSLLTSEAQKMSITLPPVSKSSITESIISRHEQVGISRMQMQSLFAPLSKETGPGSKPVTTHSSIYPSLRPLATEVAPQVRNILRHDIAMEKEHRNAINLLSLSGKRTTRTARLAVEGSNRRRKERWLRGLGADVVERSAGEGWATHLGRGEEV